MMGAAPLGQRTKNYLARHWHSLIARFMGSMVRRLQRLSLEHAISFYYQIQSIVSQRVNLARPHLKIRLDTPFSFFDFILRHVHKDQPLSLIDIGSNDCQLDAQLSEQLHVESTFTCYDISLARNQELPANVSFRQADFVELCVQGLSESYDYAILGAFLGTVDSSSRRLVLEWLAGHCHWLLIREVPRLTNDIDIFCKDRLVQLKGWDNFTETGLKQLISNYGFEIMAIEHEYDIFILAENKKWRASDKSYL